METRQVHFSKTKTSDFIQDQCDAARAEIEQIKLTTKVVIILIL